MKTTSISENNPNAHVQLPVELLRIIFCFVTENSQFIIPEGIATDERAHLLHVCSYWRAVAWETPQLWSDIVIHLDSRPLEALAIAVAILSRTLGILKTITLKPGDEVFEFGKPRIRPDEFIQQLVIPFGSSIKKLKLKVQLPYVKSLLLPQEDVELPALESLSFAGAWGKVPDLLAPGTTSKLKIPRLAAVEAAQFIRSIGVTTFLDAIRSSQLTTFVVNRPLPPDTCYHIISGCTNLTSCSLFCLKLYYSDIPIETLPVLVLPQLERFHIRQCGDRFQTFLSRFVLPSIRDLALKSSEYSYGWTPQLSNILANQCGSSLEHLYIASAPWFRERHSFEGFDKVLEKHGSTLKRLYIPKAYNSTLDNAVVQRLVSRELCPNLESLSLEYHRSTPPRLRAVLRGVLDAEAAGWKPVKELFLSVGYVWRGPILGDITLPVLEKKFEHFSARYYNARTCSTVLKYSRPTTLEDLEIEWFGYYG